MAVTSEKIEFRGAGGDMLAARLDCGPVRPKACALFAHCFTCSKDSRAATRISRALAEHGIAVLRFDFTGLGASEGDFANTNFSSNVADLVAAADWLRENRAAPSILIGHSLGGAAVLAAAGEVPDAKAVVTIGAPADPAHADGLFADDIAAIEADGAAEVTLAGRTFTVRKQFLDDIAGQDLAAHVRDLHKALLVFHAPRDDYVSIDNATKIFVAAKHPKSFVSLDDADHLLTRTADAIYVGDVIAAWAERYLGGEALADPDEAESGTVVVAENGRGRYSQDVIAGRHYMQADEPRSVGGLNSGPTPYQLVSAGLGACTSMTLRMYADRKGIPLQRVSVEVSHDKIHAEDCAECETREGMLDRFDRVIALEGDLDDATRQRLLEIADKCPVHRTLHSEVRVVTRLRGS